MDTPFHQAARDGDVDQIRELLQQGKYQVNCTDNNGWTPLHWACDNGCLGVVRVLVLEFKADLTIKTIGNTA